MHLKLFFYLFKRFVNAVSQFDDDLKVPNRHSTYGRVNVKNIQLFLE